VRRQVALDRIHDAISALFKVESMLPRDSDERRFVKSLRAELGMQEVRIADAARDSEET
jgi:hypothetical protein